MNTVVVYGSTLVFLAAELAGLLSGLSIEQTLIRSLALYVVIFMTGTAIVRIIEKAAPVDAGTAASADTGSTVDVTTPDIPAVPAEAPAASLVAAETEGKEQVHQEVEAAFKQKPKEMAQIISSVMKNE